MILMYDNLRTTNYNPKNCNQLACSEIRAANIAGYCNNSYSYVNAYVDTRKNSSRNIACVKSKSVEHMETYYEHCVEEPLQYINNVWEKCYADKSPIKDFAREDKFISI